MQQQMELLAKRHRINLKKPFEDLPKKSRDILLEGRPTAIRGSWRFSRRPTIPPPRRIGSGSRNTCRRPSARPVTGSGLRPASLSVRGQETFRLPNSRRPSIARALLTVRNWEFQTTAKTQIARPGWWTKSAAAWEFLIVSRPGLLEPGTVRRRRFPGAKAQRIRLATQIGSKLRGVTLTFLDEPSIGPAPARQQPLCWIR